MRVDKGGPSFRPPLKVVQHRGEQLWKHRKCECDQTHQDRFEQAETCWRFLQAVEHARPKIHLQLRVLPGRQCRPQLLADEVEFAGVMVHGRIPIFSRLARRSPTARATRIFTALSEMFKALAISWYETSSIRARLAATRSRRGSERKARAIWSRVSACSRGSEPGGSIGSNK